MTLKSTDWTAIKWYAKENGYTMKDMFAGPMIAFRDKNDKKVEVNLFDIKTKYSKKAKVKGNKVAS